MLPAHSRHIRQCSRADVPSIADLWMRAFRRQSRPAPERLCAYCETVFFQHPWDTSGIGPLGCFGPTGLEGFIGVVPRPMRYEGRSVTAAIATQLMVDPALDHGMTSFQLLRRLLEGPQDLTFSDGANELARRIWERAGGAVARLFGFEWSRPLDPIRLGLDRVARMSVGAVPIRTLVLRSLLPRKAALPGRQAPAGRTRARPALSPRFHEEPADASTLVTQWNESRRALTPAYDLRTVRWMLRQLTALPGLGDLRTSLLRNAQGTIVGSWIGYVQQAGRAQLLCVSAKPSCVGEVFDHLFTSLHRLSATCVEGQLDPGHAPALSDRSCRIVCSQGALVHARRPDLLQAVLRGDATLSRLDGEWWMRFAASCD